MINQPSSFQSPYSQQRQRHSWKSTVSPTSEGYTPNELLESYGQWKKAFIGEQLTIAERNFNKVTDTIEDIINKLSASKIQVLESYVRINNQYSFSALLLVDEEVFLSRDFKRAYEISRPIQQSIVEDILQFELSFASKTDETDEDVIYSEGFYCKRSNNE